MSPAVIAHVNRYVSSDPTVLGGAPVISGTRIPIERIRQLIIQGKSPEEVADDYSWVEKRKIYRAVAHLMKAGLDVFEKTHKTQTPL